MKLKKTMICILSSVVCINAMSACSQQDSNSAQTSTAFAESKQNSSDENKKTDDESKSDDSTDVKMHTLMIRDSLKNETMTATFINSVSGASADIPMSRTKEENDSYIYTCEADTNLYNMALITAMLLR